jgi:nitroreductase
LLLLQLLNAFSIESYPVVYIKRLAIKKYITSEHYVNITKRNNNTCSRRKYLSEPIDSSAVAKLQTLIAEYVGKENLNIQLVLGNGDAFKGFRKSYGMFSGVQNYLGLIGNKNDFEGIEKLGYYGELLVLYATELGLGTCWVGGTFHRASCPFNLSEDETIICTITIGNVPQKLSAKEKIIHGFTHRKTKTAKQMYTSPLSVPDWFLSGMEAVRLAPSAVNRQPVMFSYDKDDIVTASVKDVAGDGFALDLGIAKLHFELGAGSGTWVFGNGSKFIKGVE